MSSRHDVRPDPRGDGHRTGPYRTYLVVRYDGETFAVQGRGLTPDDVIADLEEAFRSGDDDPGAGPDPEDQVIFEGCVVVAIVRSAWDGTGRYRVIRLDHDGKATLGPIVETR